MEFLDILVKWTVVSVKNVKSSIKQEWEFEKKRLLREIEFMEERIKTREEKK